LNGWPQPGNGREGFLAVSFTACCAICLPTPPKLPQFFIGFPLKATLGYTFARSFARIYLIFKRLTHRDLPGLGKALDLIKTEGTLTVNRLQFHFEPRVARAYGLMIIGEWNEPETHSFLRNVIAEVDEEVNFVDVGASIGEFVIDMAACKKIASVIAFEPQLESAEAIKKSCAVNGFQNVRIVQKIVTDVPKEMYFLQNGRSPTASRPLFSSVQEVKESQQLIKTIGTTLDEELVAVEAGTIVLLDIEGGEYLAMKGALGFLRRCKPLLIFEYNSVSRESFNLNMVRNLLGPDYSLYRLRADGRVDSDEVNTWNMVAVEKSSVFFNIVTALRYEC
jgi:FkbM family methyltransferase